jgi:hypothetical protein
MVEAPFNSFSPAVSSDVSQCLCNVGYTGPDGGPCEECEAGKYKNVTGSDTCAHCPGCCFLHSSLAPCPLHASLLTRVTTTYCTVFGPTVNSTSGPASVNLSSCVCIAGFTLPEHCRAQAAGNVSNTTAANVSNAMCDDVDAVDCVPCQGLASEGRKAKQVTGMRGVALICCACVRRVVVSVVVEEGGGWADCMHQCAEASPCDSSRYIQEPLERHCMHALPR